MPRVSKLKRMPQELREELDRRLTEGGFRDYRGLAKWLGEQGWAIDFAEVHKYGQKLEKRLELVRVATAQARAVVAASAGDPSADPDDRLSEALLRLVQQDLFAVLVELDPAKINGTNLASLARSVAQMVRSSLQQHKWAEEWREKIEARTAAASDKVLGTVRTATGGLTASAEEEIRRALVGITD